MRHAKRGLGTAAMGTAVCGVVVLIAGGCSSRSADINAIRLNPSPEVMTLHERPTDVRNTITVMWDENIRMANEDLGRFWYWNRPSRLTLEPIPR